MSSPTPAARLYDQGFKSDSPRGTLPPGACYRMRDWIPQLGSPARKRGGFSYASKDLNSVSAASYMSGCGWAPFPNDPHLVAVSDGGKVYQVKTFDTTGGTYLGATSFSPLTHRPFWHNDRLIILQALGATAADPYKITVSGGVYTLANVAGTPPKASVGWSWGDYLAVANGTYGGTLYPRRIWWCDVANPDSWTATSVWDMPEDVVGGVSMRSFQMVFGYAAVWALTGDTPPPGGNMARRTLFAGNGCMDGNTIAQYREYAIWANNSGVFKSDGSILTDLTTRGGISQFWAEQVASFNYSTGWRARAGVWNGHYFVTVYNPGGSEITLACDIENEVWFQFTNFKPTMYATRSTGPGTATAGGFEEMFFSHRSSPRICSISSCWTPSSTVASDADGTAVQPEIETDFFTLGIDSKKRFRRAYVTHDTRTAGGSPYLEVSALYSPESSSYTAVTPTLDATTQQTRRHVNLRREAIGVGLKITQVGASADTRLYGIDLDAHAIEASR